MKHYKVRIVETLVMDVDAESAGEAEQIVSDRWRDSEYKHRWSPPFIRTNMLIRLSLQVVRKRGTHSIPVTAGTNIKTVSQMRSMITF